MLFLKSKLTNFKPYFGSDNVVVLHNESDKRLVTLNVGPTGNGKTSLSDAILWTLYGDKYKKDWKHWINKLAIKVAKAGHQEVVSVSVELHVVIDSKTYKISRRGEYNISKNSISETILNIEENGSPLSKPVDFINEHFPNNKLIKYFIFDSEEMINDFTRNPKDAIRDHLNKMTGIDALRQLSASLNEIVSSYELEKSEQLANSPGFDKTTYQSIKSNQAMKQSNIQDRRKEISNWEDEQRKLFPRGISTSEKTLKNILDRIQNAKTKRKDLADKFKKNIELISNIHLIFLEEILVKSIQKLNSSATTKQDWNTALDVIKSTLTGKFAGVYFDSNEPYLIDRGVTLKNSEKRGLEDISLIEGQGGKMDELTELNDKKNIADNTKQTIFDYRDNYNKLTAELTSARQDLKAFGEKEEDSIIQKNIEIFQELETKIEEAKKNCKEVEIEIKDLQNQLNDLEQKRQKNDEIENNILEIDNKILRAKGTCNIVDETCRTFITDLLDQVTKNASEFFLSVVKEGNKRFGGIKIDSDYELNILDKDGRVMDKDTQISKGTLEIGLIAFIYGLPAEFQQLPYVIDNPLMRLDSGHQKRLVSALIDKGHQLIMHLIPGPEYNHENFEWFAPSINTQNWIEKHPDVKHKTSDFIHSIQNKDSTSAIEFKAEDL